MRKIILPIIQNKTERLKFTVGKVNKFDPKIKDALDYTWRMCGSLISSDAVLEFQPAALGEFEISLLTNNRHGSDRATYILDVVEAVKVEKVAEEVKEPETEEVK